MSIRFVSMVSGFFLTIFTLVVLSPGLSTLTQQDERTVLYKKFNEQKHGSAEQQKLAYETAKEFLARFGTDEDEHTRDVRRWVSSYEKLLELGALIGAKDYAKGFELGHQILASDPDNFYVLTKLTEAGLTGAQAGNSTFTAQAVALARKGIQLIGSGKVKDPSPFANISTARNFFHIALATLVLDVAPEESAKIFLELAHSDEYKSEPSIYYYFGRALLKGEYQKLVTEYKQKYEGKPSSPEQKATLDRISQVVARIIDTYARAVALSTRPEQQETKTEVLNQLLPMYKALHNNSDAGLTELISSILTKPMP